MSIRFPTFGPHISKIDQQYVSKAMLPKNWYNKPYYFVEKFEKDFAKYTNRIIPRFMRGEEYLKEAS